jgi:hypothetical protein
LLDAHQRAWQRIAAPGTWLTGAKRVAIAREVRNAIQCGFCAERKASLMTYGVTGSHETVTNLPAAQIELIHRLATDSAPLKRSWARELIDNGLSEEEYVETVASPTPQSRSIRLRMLSGCLLAKFLQQLMGI